MFMSTELEVLDCTAALRESRRAHVAPSGERRNLTAKSLYLGNRDVYRRGDRFASDRAKKPPRAAFS